MGIFIFAHRVCGLLSTLGFSKKQQWMQESDEAKAVGRCIGEFGKLQSGVFCASYGA